MRLLPHPRQTQDVPPIVLRSPFHIAEIEGIRHACGQPRLLIKQRVH